MYHVVTIFVTIFFFLTTMVIYRYVTELAKALNITTNEATKTPPMVWDGKTFNDPAKLRTKFMARTSNKNLGKCLTKYTDDLSATYGKMTNNATFATIPDFLKLGGLGDLMGTTAAKFLSDNSVTHNLPEFVVEPLLLDTFGQSLSAANAIAGMIGFDVQENTGGWMV